MSSYLSYLVCIISQRELPIAVSLGCPNLREIGVIGSTRVSISPGDARGYINLPLHYSPTSSPLNYWDS